MGKFSWRLGRLLMHTWPCQCITPQKIISCNPCDYVHFLKALMHFLFICSHCTHSPVSIKILCTSEIFNKSAIYLFTGAQPPRFQSELARQAPRILLVLRPPRKASCWRRRVFSAAVLLCCVGVNCRNVFSTSKLL